MGSIWLVTLIVCFVLIRLQMKGRVVTEPEPEKPKEPKSLPVLVTQAEELKWLPDHIAADFDCPSRGPHAWRTVKAADVEYYFCLHCPRKIRRVDPARGLYF